MARICSVFARKSLNVYFIGFGICVDFRGISVDFGYSMDVRVYALVAVWMLARANAFVDVSVAVRGFLSFIIYIYIYYFLSLMFTLQ